MKKEVKAGNKATTGPLHRGKCDYKRILISLPDWMAEELSSIFLQEQEYSRTRLIEWWLAKGLGYTKKTYAEKCKKSGKAETRKSRKKP